MNSKVACEEDTRQADKNGREWWSAGEMMLRAKTKTKTKTKTRRKTLNDGE